MQAKNKFYSNAKSFALTQQKAIWYNKLQISYKLYRLTMSPDIYQTIELAFSLLGAFAALLWLRPGKQQATRYAIIVLSFAGLCAILHQNPGEYGIAILQHLVYIMPLFVFLLGKYMLSSTKRRAFLALGVYALVKSLGALAHIPLNMLSDCPVSLALLTGVDFYLTLVWAWLFIWLCTRKDAAISRSDRIYVAAAVMTVYGSLVSCWPLFRSLPFLFTNLTSEDIPQWVSLSLYFVPMLLNTLCFAAGLRYVLHQSWVRTLCTTAAAIFVLNVPVYAYHYFVQQAEERSLRQREELIVAIQDGNRQKVRELLSLGVNVNRPLIAPNDTDDEISIFYPLIHAAARNHIDMVQDILAAGADVNVQRQNGDTALIAAAIEGNPETTQLLLQAGADVHATGYDGATALHNATLPETEADRPGALAVMRLLLEHGVPINAQDSYGDTALMQCVRDNFIEGARLLLEHSADPTLRDKTGKSPLEYAEQKGLSEMAEMLRAALQKGAE